MVENNESEKGYVWMKCGIITYVTYCFTELTGDKFSSKLDGMGHEWDREFMDRQGRRILEIVARLGFNISNIGNTTTLRRSIIRNVQGRHEDISVLTIHRRDIVLSEKYKNILFWEYVDWASPTTSVSASWNVALFGCNRVYQKRTIPLGIV